MTHYKHLTPVATVVVTTKNRKHDLRRALNSILAQDVPIEISVMDDGSDDGTAEMVRREFSGINLFRSEAPLGLIVQRNQAARFATTEFVFSIDDDAEFSSPDIVNRTLAEFADPHVGAVAIPHVDTRTNTVVNRKAPDDGQVWCIASFTGTAYAVRRSTFLELGGFNESLVHQGEESDYCIRMLNAGYFVRLGGAEPIMHHESPQRNLARMAYYGRRNDVTFAWRYAPRSYLVPHMLATTSNGIYSAFRLGSAINHLHGLLSGWAAIPRRRSPREPVSCRTYRAFRTLKKYGPLPLSKIDYPLVNQTTE